MKPHVWNCQPVADITAASLRRMVALFATITVFAMHMVAMLLLWDDTGLGLWMPALIAFGFYASILQFACTPRRRTAWMPLHAVLAGFLCVLSLIGGLMLVVGKHGA